MTRFVPANSGRGLRATASPVPVSRALVFADATILVMAALLVAVWLFLPKDRLLEQRLREHERVHLIFDKTFHPSLKLLLLP